MGKRGLWGLGGVWRVGASWYESHLYVNQHSLTFTIIDELYKRIIATGPFTQIDKPCFQNPNIVLEGLQYLTPSSMKLP
jgi:hypothetical protein